MENMREDEFGFAFASGISEWYKFKFGIFFAQNHP